jgi:hypothetical protein
MCAVYRRRGRTIGTLIIAGLLVFAFAYALLGPRTTPPVPFVKADLHGERALRLGASVFAADGALVGTVAGISRLSTGRIERIRVTTPPGRTVIVNEGAFTVDGNSVRLALSIGEIKTLPSVMAEDGVSG